MSTRIIVVDVVSVVNGVVVVIIIGVVVVVVCVVVDVDGVFVVGVVVVVVIGPTILLFIWKVFCFRVDWKGWKAFLDQFFFNATRLLKQHAMMISTKRSCPLPQIPFRLTGCTIFSVNSTSTLQLFWPYIIHDFAMQHFPFCYLTMSYEI